MGVVKLLSVAELERLAQRAEVQLGPYSHTLRGLRAALKERRECERRRAAALARPVLEQEGERDDR